MHYAIDVAPGMVNRANLVVREFELPVTVLHGDSKAIVWRQGIDLLYVDGGHSSEQVYGDLENYAPWVRRGGLMVLDDYGKRHLGVTEAADTWMTVHFADWSTMGWPWCWWLLCRRL